MQALKEIKEMNPVFLLELTDRLTGRIVENMSFSIWNRNSVHVIYLNKHNASGIVRNLLSFSLHDGFLD